MLNRMAPLPFVVLASVVLLGQQPPTPSNPSQLNEFPVMFQQDLVAGKTPMGTKIKAKLTASTLQNGLVVPRNAVLSGEVTESAAKTKTTPSRLAVRIDLAEWKNGSAPLTAYLTNWYYPTLTQAGQDLQYGPTQSERSTWNGQGAYPDQNTKSYQPFPGRGSDKDSPVPDTPSSVTSSRATVLKDIDCEHVAGGAMALTSKKSNIRLDRYTTYVVGTGNLPTAK